MCLTVECEDNIKIAFEKSGDSMIDADDIATLLSLLICLSYDGSFPFKKVAVVFDNRTAEIFRKINLRHVPEFCKSACLVKKNLAVLDIVPKCGCIAVKALPP